MAGYRYGVLGAGRQGTAAAYDLAVRGGATSVTLADSHPGAAGAAAAKVNRMSGRDLAHGMSVAADDHRKLVGFLEPLDAFLSAVPYGFNLGVSRAALEAGTHMCDLGGNTRIVLSQLDLDPEARERGVCLVPDCGEAPGMGNNLMAHALSLLDETEELLLLDGGIPQHPRPPWNYELTFNIDGLTNEYDGATTYVRDGRLVEVECFEPEEYELVDLGPPFGTLEAFVAAAGSTTPWTLGKSVRSLKTKVLRYPGHAAQFKAFRDAGFFDQIPVLVDGSRVVPRQLFHALLEPRIRATEQTRDVVIARAVATGRRQGQRARATVDVRVHYDDRLGFTAMEQATGWHAAIVCRLMADGSISPGATPVEIAVSSGELLAQLRERGFEVRESVDRLR